MPKIVDVILNKKKFSTPPIWVMRQAGRYLPEYREIRSKTENFLDLCYNPKLASEVTLQPIDRFDFDAAIIFSDILVIPDALGIDVKFVKNEGPKLKKISSSEDLKNLKTENIINHLKPVFEAISLTRSRLDKEKALIGFSGSPFTLACYMIEGGSSKNFDSVKKSSIKDKKFFMDLIEILTDAVIIYLINQIKSGADIIKLFDSWAGILTPNQIEKFVINPTKKIISEVKKLYPKIPVITFPKGIGQNYETFTRLVNPDCVAIDQNLSLDFVRENLQKKFGATVQGNLDNFLLAFGSEKQIEEEVLRILKNLGSNPFVFNLGHGILPETPIQNVEKVIKIVRTYS